MGHHHYAGALPGGQLLRLLACRHHCADYHLLYQQLSFTEVYEQQQLARPRSKSDTQLCQGATRVVKFATGVVKSATGVVKSVTVVVKSVTVVVNFAMGIW